MFAYHYVITNLDAYCYFLSLHIFLMNPFENDIRANFSRDFVFE